MRTRVLRLRGRWAALSVSGLLAGAALMGATSAQATAVAHRTSTCSIAKVYNRLGPTYVEHLAVSGATCQGAETFVRAYNTCRLKSGGLKGHCTHKLDGFTCAERRQSSLDQFEAVVSCTKPREAVSFTYSENT